MSLIPCADCGREISSLAPACVHCGRPASPAAAVPGHALAAAAPGCPLCGAGVTNPRARTGGRVWCERCGGQLVYGTDGALVRALPRAQAQAVQPRRAMPVVVVNNQKSVGLAILLTMCFGPLGMLYSTVGGAFIMFLVMTFTTVVTLGLGLFVTYPLCILWAALAANEHNKRLTYAVSVAA
jgi:uncharacterized paraquat-inducible protein A